MARRPTPCSRYPFTMGAMERITEVPAPMIRKLLADPAVPVLKGKQRNGPGHYVAFDEDNHAKGTPPMDDTLPSPWLSAKQAGAYLQRSPRFVLREIKAGRLRGAVVSGRGRGEVLTRKEWLDAWVEDRTQPQPMPFTSRRRA